jgi:hypothetical protein
MAFEESTAGLFPADLFLQPGEQPPIMRENLGREMCDLYREVGIFASEKPVLQTVDRLEKLGLKWIHPMHGGSMNAETSKYFVRAMRDGRFAYDGKLFGRALPT